MGRAKVWRPRNNLPLSALDKRPSKVDIFTKSWLGRIPRVFLHPVWGLMVGALIAFSGRQELQLRSAGLLLVAAWLAIDIWAWLIKKESTWKFALGWTSTSLLLIGVMGIMWWWLDSKLYDDRLDTLAKMTVSMSAPGNADPLSSIVTINNPSLHDVTVRHADCWMNHVTYANGMNFERSFSHLPLALANPLVRGQGDRTRS
jgi:hypothetical protein